MNKARRIYLLSPKEFSPETIAVTFAKTSRSPQSFDEIAAELTEDKSSKFHEKWVVGYGHASVAEHAVLHLALENVSRLAIETIEGNRLASYTEKSTRYQKWDENAFFVPDELADHPLKERYLTVCQDLFRTYQDCIPKVKTTLRGSVHQLEGESDKAYDRRIQTACIDVCRFLLPAASLANVGVTINARALEYAICKMLSSPLLEVQQIGETLQHVAKRETPTLIKYAACNQYMLNAREQLRQVGKFVSPSPKEENFTLISFTPQGEDQILAALLVRFTSNADYKACLHYVGELNQSQKKELVSKIMGTRGQFDQPLREFEYATMTFEAVMDQGAYFEFKRHRMMTQTTQLLAPFLGFAIPRLITEAGYKEEYLRVMRSAAQLYQDLARWNPDVASYVIPNGFNRRVLFTMNLREAFNLTRLRAAENAHFSIRRVALQIAEEIRGIYPSLGAYLDAPDEDWRDIEERYFSSVLTN